MRRMKIEWENDEFIPRTKGRFKTFRDYILWRIEGKYKVLSNGCWKWERSLSTVGYSSVGIGRRGEDGMVQMFNISGSRAVAAAFHGLRLSDDSQYACHKCDNKWCINPDHIYVGTAATNIQDHITRNKKKRIDADIRCKRGHTYTEDTKRIRASGKIYCRVCMWQTWAKHCIKEIEKRGYTYELER